MRPFNVRVSNRLSYQGFTLPEVMVVVIIVGILSAIMAPNMLGWYARQRLNHAVVEVQGALQEAQRQAIRNSRSCALTIDTTAITGDCLATGSRNFSNLSIQSSQGTGGTFNFRFNLRGIPTNTAATPQPLTQPVTIVLSSPSTSSKKCLVLSTPLGLIRTGNYTGTGTPTESNCISQS